MIEVTADNVIEAGRELANPQVASVGSLVLIGCLVVALIFILGWQVLSFRLKPVEKLESKIDKMSDCLTDIKSSLWKADLLDSKIGNIAQSLISEHERTHHAVNK